MKKSIRLIINGTVQNVSFRQFVKDYADKYKIKGFARNLDDGRLEVFIEGDMPAVDQMTALCKRGPPYANIRNVEEKPEKFQGFKEFKILNF